MKHDINCYWVEGNCEKEFVKSSPLMGKVEIIDLTELSNDQVRKRTMKLSGNKKNLWLNIVFDTDVIKTCPIKLERFLSNLKYLENQGFQMRLLQQENDFEDEIMKCNKLTLKTFLTLFKVVSKSEFKSSMLSQNSMYTKITKTIKGFSLWDSPMCIDLIIHSAKQSSFHLLPKK